ncbi:TolB family protein [Bdellovibrio sp. HCB2-146]|uniref:TolB family protein n=1 Tax=Bdellovibrio sp. HCB2-146 TaxID=3394362 RepID=UPI0039BD72D9
MKSTLYSTSSGLSGDEVDINMEEYIYQSKIRFKNLPAGAVLSCGGTTLTDVLYAVDLSGDEDFDVRFNYWLNTASPWSTLENRSFTCSYELNGQTSSEISFNISLKESDIVMISNAPYTGVESHSYFRLTGAFDSGRYILFESSLADLVPGDTNSTKDIFLLDTQTNTTSRISVSTAGVEGNGESVGGAASLDGRYVVFNSYATNLVAGDVNGFSDIFLRDRQLGTTTRISVGLAGAEADSDSFAPSISMDGRYVVFVSYASNLVAGDSNGSGDVFRLDLQSGVITLVSQSTAGVQSNSSAGESSISNNGQFVVFSSDANNLVAGDTNNQQDIFVRDMVANTTTRVSVTTAGVQANGYSMTPTISGDGRYVAWEAGATNLVAGDTNGGNDIFLRDLQAGTTTLVSKSSAGVIGNGYSFSPKISKDGNFVSFASHSTNLVAGDTNTRSDLFVYDIQAATTSRANQGLSGTESNEHIRDPMISSSGRYVAFASVANNLVIGDTNQSEDIFVIDRDTGVTSRFTQTVQGAIADSDAEHSSISDDGRFIAFDADSSNLVTGDTNGSSDVFVHDRGTGVTIRASVSSAGVEGNANSQEPQISGNGRYVVFMSYASNLVAGDTNGLSDVFVHDLQTSTTIRASVGASGVEANQGASGGAISDDGRYVVFHSSSTNLVAGDTNGTSDAFVRDLQLGVTTRVSVGPAGLQANGGSTDGSISSDGQVIAFTSDATNLVGGDTNARSDVFVHDIGTATTTRVSVSTGGTEGNDISEAGKVSGNGRYVVFNSHANTLVAGDTNASRDVFVHDLQTGITTRESLNSSGGEGNGSSYFPSISDDGMRVVFYSEADDLVSGDTNSQEDVFIRDRVSGNTVRLSTNALGMQSNDDSFQTAISGDGRYVSFTSWATNLTAGNIYEVGCIFVKKVPF